MIKDLISGKTCVYIDAENMFYAQRDLGWRISYERLRDYLLREAGNDTKIYVYKGIDPKNQGQRRFLDMLDMLGFKVTTKPVKKIRLPNGRVKWKNNLDVELAIDLVEDLPHCDNVVLFSGDSDFVPALKRVRDQKKNMLVFSARGRTSREIADFSKYIYLGDIRSEIEMKRGSKNSNK